MIHFTLFTFQMYSSSPRFQQKEFNNHSNGLNKHVTTSKIFTGTYICNNSRMASLHYFHFFIIWRNYFPYSVLLFFYFKILIANLGIKHFDF